MLKEDAKLLNYLFLHQHRLITHNMLQCNVRGVENGYPLIIEVEEVDGAIEEIPSAFDSEQIKILARKINWKCLLSAARNIEFPMQIFEDCEDTPADSMLSNDSFLMSVHKLLFDIHVNKGYLICPESGRKFPINDGIPNMLLHEDEV